MLRFAETIDGAGQKMAEKLATLPPHAPSSRRISRHPDLGSTASLFRHLFDVGGATHVGWPRGEDVHLSPAM